MCFSKTGQTPIAEGVNVSLKVWGWNLYQFYMEGQFLSHKISAVYKSGNAVEGTDWSLLGELSEKWRKSEVVEVTTEF